MNCSWHFVQFIRFISSRLESKERSRAPSQQAELSCNGWGGHTFRRDREIKGVTKSQPRQEEVWGVCIAAPTMQLCPASKKARNKLLKAIYMHAMLSKCLDKSGQGYKNLQAKNGCQGK